MKRTGKVAVSVPYPTLDSLDAACRRTKRTRSSAVAEAIEMWLAHEAPSDADRRYTEGYLKHPEHTSETANTAAAAVEHWDPWE